MQETMHGAGGGGQRQELFTRTFVLADWVVKCSRARRLRAGPWDRLQFALMQINTRFDVM
jgi:hypothetical protein